MNLRYVTFTGADDKTSIVRMVDLSERYKFIEWGILIGSGAGGRFPGIGWVSRLLYEITAHHAPLKTSWHFCGECLRSLQESMSVHPPMAIIAKAVAPRIQLNFHGESQEQFEPFEVLFFDALRRIPAETIFQIDGCDGERLLRDYLQDASDAVPLFDLSYGAGQSPDSWPSPFLMVNDTDYALHGYAGGLGPDNIKDELPRIVNATNGAPFWIDMETRVRTHERFDLNKVEAVCDIVAGLTNGSVR